ncbi:MAG: PCYCGC motif-containing (lipo)protein [Bacilli bacterium]
MKMKFSILFIVFALTLSACANDSAKEDEHGHAQQESGDLRETTASSSDMPTFLAGTPELVSAAYKIVAKNTDVLAYIPCYCGCGESVDHKSNLDCFINEEKSSGEIVWDSHATTCQNCIEIGVVASKMNSEGSSLQEIRDYIDATYKEGYAKPTPTPMPPN